MPHLVDVLALDGALDPDGELETHLHLTDYRSLYVADIGEITRDAPRDEDLEHVPAYYTENGLHCDCWFQLLDIRVLVRDDLESVAVELVKLRNTRHHDRPISLYGGMVDLPLKTGARILGSCMQPETPPA